MNLLNKHWWFFVGLLLSVALLWPLVAAPMFSHHDDIQIIRLHQMHQCIQDGQIPCRWVPDLGGLYGYPLFNYYGPLPYYFGEIIYLLTGSLILSVKFMFGAAFLGAYLFMYLLARKLWGEVGGVVSAVFYSFAPYHALVFYVRGAMGELWGLMFYPALIWAIWRLKEEVRLANILLVALFSALLMTSHNLSAMIFLPVALAVAIFLFIQNSKQSKKFLKFSLLSLVLGFLLSGFYWFPVLAEKNLVHVDTTTVGYFSYTEHFKGIKKLVLERTWEWGTSVREVPGGEKDTMSYQIGWIHLLGWMLALVAAWRVWKKDKRTSLLIGLSSIAILLSIFMINPRSDFIWKLIEPLKYLQFPWRLLSLIIFFISLVAGASLLIVKDKFKRVLAFGLILLVLLFNFAYFRPEKFLYFSEQELLSGQLWRKQIMRSIFDFLPIYAKAPPAEMADRQYQIITGNAEIKNFSKGSNWYYFNADVEDTTIIRLSQYYFPQWQVSVDGKEVEINPKNELGLITFALDPGKHRVEAKLNNTPVRIFGNAMTIFGVVVCVGLFLAQFKRVRHWFGYTMGGFNR